MREIALGQWTYFAWHLPTALLCAAMGGVAMAMVRSLWREQFSVAERRLRFSVLGWSAVLASVLSLAVWPYLAAFASVEVRRDGTWALNNYLGVPIAVVPAGESRRLEGQDLGGLNLGSGRIRVLRADGSVVESVRVSGSRFDRARIELGYPEAALRPARGCVLTGAHTYGPNGPVLAPAFALR
jgi:MFS family permease